MSKAPGSPSFSPPANARLRGTMPKLGGLPRLDRLSLNPPALPSEPSSNEESPPPVPVVPVIIEPEATKAPSPPNPRRNSQTTDDDINALDDEAWSRVANAGGIEEMLKLGEGVSGSVSKCRLRKSGQIFAIKVCLRPC
jgi:hypothetical protein